MTGELAGRRLTHEQRIFLLALVVGLPGSATALVLLWTGAFSLNLRWTLTLVIVGVWVGASVVLRARVVHPLHTLSNLLGGLREGDFSIRARQAPDPDGALGLAFHEVNVLGSTLRQQRLGALEANTLLRKVMAEIDVAIFAFDGDGQLKLVNRAGEKLLNRPMSRLIGRTAAELGLSETLTGPTPRTLESRYPGGSGRWELRRTRFRQEGLRHQLVVLADLSRALREEERQAWKRLVRVLGHEINNSLAPILSLTESLEGVLESDPRPDDADEDVREGLAVIGARARALNRFMTSYARLARLPPPTLQPMEVRPWVERVAGLETRMPVAVHAGPDMVIGADSDQLEQLLINLVTNAVDASLQTGGGVGIDWQRRGESLEVMVRDEGPGIGDSANLFVPFFTTKPEGTGIGLALSRQIAESHGGSLTLENRGDGAGAVARLVLPTGLPD